MHVGRCWPSQPIPCTPPQGSSRACHDRKVFLFSKESWVQETASKHQLFVQICNMNNWIGYNCNVCNILWSRGKQKRTTHILYSIARGARRIVQGSHTNTKCFLGTSRPHGEIPHIRHSACTIQNVFLKKQYKTFQTFRKPETLIKKKTSQLPASTS